MHFAEYFWSFLQFVSLVNDHLFLFSLFMSCVQFSNSASFGEAISLLPFPVWCPTNSQCHFNCNESKTFWVYLMTQRLYTLTDPGFPRRGGVPTYYLTKIFPKTAWKWKKLDLGGGRPWRPLRYANGIVATIFISHRINKLSFTNQINKHYEKENNFTDSRFVHNRSKSRSMSGK